MVKTYNVHGTLTHVSEIVLPPCIHLSLNILESLKVTFILHTRNVRHTQSDWANLSFVRPHIHFPHVHWSERIFKISEQMFCHIFIKFSCFVRSMAMTLSVHFLKRNCLSLVLLILCSLDSVPGIKMFSLWKFTGMIFVFISMMRYQFALRCAVNKMYIGS